MSCLTDKIPDRLLAFKTTLNTTLLNADFDRHVVVPPPDAAAWAPSPQPGVHRHRLDRIGDEVARATRLVRYDAGSHFERQVEPAAHPLRGVPVFVGHPMGRQRRPRRLEILKHAADAGGLQGRVGAFANAHRDLGTLFDDIDDTVEDATLCMDHGRGQAELARRAGEPSAADHRHEGGLCLQKVQLVESGEILPDFGADAQPPANARQSGVFGQWTRNADR